MASQNAEKISSRKNPATTDQEAKGNRSLPAVPAMQKKAPDNIAVNDAIQRAGMEEEEPVQGKFAIQKASTEEEEPAQGKFIVQKAGAEEEEPAQGKFIVQKAGAEEEEPVQGKFIVQKAGAEEEEPAQGKFIVQKAAAEEEEPAQGKFIVQKAGAEEEEPAQGKFIVQKVGAEEEEPVQGKFIIQKAAAEEEEPAQGKFIVQKAGAEEEEPAQGKFIVQKAGAEEEEPVQGKFIVQKAGAEEEEPAQGKFIVQKVGAEEEEPAQGKFIVQKAGAEEEEPAQGKFIVQKAGAEEEEPAQGKFIVQKAGAEEEEPVQGKFNTAQLKKATEQSSSSQIPVQKKTNDTGLPDNLKAGIEGMSGHDMSDVKVHYNSSKPAQLQAHAYAQGTNIHIGPGQEKHLPHEAWHVVQQKQGRVQATMQMKSGVPVNDDRSLEHEADVMGEKAMSAGVRSASGEVTQQVASHSDVTQRAAIDLMTKWEEISPAKPLSPVEKRMVTTAESWGFLAAVLPWNNETQARVQDLKAFYLTPALPTSIKGVADGLMGNTWRQWATNNEILKDILKGPFEANWFKVRGALIMDQWPTMTPEQIAAVPHDNSVLFMNSMVDMRWALWKNFTNMVLPEMQNEVAAKAKSAQVDATVKEKLEAEGVAGGANAAGGLAKTLDPAGSQAVSSDIDLSLGGNNTEIAVGLINRRFKEVFGVPYDPGTVFDINVYASDWIHGAAQKQTGTNMEMTPNAEVAMSKEAQAERNETMEVWSLVKICRNMDEGQWASYCNQTIDALPDNAKAKKREIHGKATAECKKFKDAVDKRVKKNDIALLADEAKLFGRKRSAWADDHFRKDAKETRASNEIYEEKLLSVKSTRLQLNVLKNEKNLDQVSIDTLGLQLANQIAEALTYANEVYATEGAVQHTVLDQGATKKLGDLKEKGTKEAAKKPAEKDAATAAMASLETLNYKLEREGFLQSANENVGDALHSLHAYHHLPHYAIYRAGKYIARLIDSTNKAIKSREVAEAIPNYSKLKTIGKKATELKKKEVSIEGKKIEGDPKFVTDDPYFKRFVAGHAEVLVPMLIQFGANMSAEFEKQKTPAAPVSAEPAAVAL